MATIQQAGQQLTSALSRTRLLPIDNLLDVDFSEWTARYFGVGICMWIEITATMKWSRVSFQKSQAGLAIACSQIDRLFRRRCLRNYVLCHWQYTFDSGKSSLADTAHCPAYRLWGINYHRDRISPSFQAAIGLAGILWTEAGIILLHGECTSTPAHSVEHKSRTLAIASEQSLCYALWLSCLRPLSKVDVEYVALDAVSPLYLEPLKLKILALGTRVNKPCGCAPPIKTFLVRVIDKHRAYIYCQDCKHSDCLCVCLIKL